jgi:DHA1 family tetracycline resistance protein-like MFS transporter
MGAVVGLTGIVGPLAMTQLFGYFSSAAAVIHFPGAPFFASASLMFGALLLLLRKARSSIGSD